jgi:hypothetical protein
MLTTAGTIANTGPPPTCSMRICNSNGEDISRAEVGDSLMLKVTIQYGTTFQVIPDLTLKQGQIKIGSIFWSRCRIEIAEEILKFFTENSMNVRTFSFYLETEQAYFVFSTILIFYVSKYGM